MTLSYSDNPFNLEGDEFIRFIPLIKDNIGHLDCLISDYGKDGKTFWFLVDFIEGNSCKSVGSMQLQFGEDPLVLVSHSIENVQLDIDLGTLYVEIMLRIKQFAVIRESMLHDVFLEFLEDDFLVYSLQVESFDPLRLPKLAEVDEVMITIKEIILSYKTESKMT